MIGKESSNYFTPLTKLSDLVPHTVESMEMENNANAEEDPHRHPAFGFKADLIRIIGNVSYKNKECQDLVSNNILSFSSQFIIQCKVWRNRHMISWYLLSVK